MAEGEVFTRDGVAVLVRGDVLMIVYQLAARLHRTRWLFDQADRLVVPKRGGFMGLLLILPSADPPDAATRRENQARMNQYGPRLRRMVTVPLGDAFHVSVVRAMMRGMTIIQRAPRANIVTDTVHSGVARLLEGASAETPSRELILEDLRAMCHALGVAPDYVPVSQSP